MRFCFGSYCANFASSLRLAVVFLFLTVSFAASAQNVNVLPPVPTPAVAPANQPRYNVPQEPLLAPTVTPASPAAGTASASAQTARPAASDSAVFFVARPDGTQVTSESVSGTIDSRTLFPASSARTAATEQAAAQTQTPAPGYSVLPAQAVTPDQIRFYFPTGDAVLRPSYLANDRAFIALDSVLRTNGTASVDSVLVVSKSSPEGDVTRNEVLAVNRANAMRRYVIGTYPDLMSRVRANAAGEAWDELRSAVLADPQLGFEARTRILAIIDSPATLESKKARLRALPEYGHLLSDIYPKLRLAAIDLRFHAPALQPETVAIDQTGVYLPLYIPIEDLWLDVPYTALVLDELPLRVRPLRMPAPAGRPGERMWLAAKTNLLYDAVTMLNAEIEVPFLYRFSLLWEDVFPWWETGNKYCLQHWEMGPELRFWFRRWDANSTQKLLGWFVGAYGMSSRYDFQYDTKVDYQGEYWSAGLCAGYVMPFRKGWLHDALNARLEFELAAGYLQTDYRHYLPTDSYDMLIRDKYNTGVARYIGPTKAKVSLVVPINFKTR